MKTETDYCLVSTGGDYSARGMGTTNTVIPYDEKHCEIVERFMRAQLEFHLHHLHKPLSKSTKKYENFVKSLKPLFDAGIFTDKYHGRTTWTARSLDDISEFEPYEIAERKTNQSEDWFDNHVIIDGPTINEKDKDFIKKTIKSKFTETSL